MPRQFASETAPPISVSAHSQDPSLLTTQALQRENLWLRDLFETRLEAMDKAIGLLQAFADRTPTTMDVQAQVIALREVGMEMFKGIKTQLVERDAQTEKASRDVKSAVDAAFAAAKEAVGEQNKSNALSISKSEAAVTKQIDGIIELIRTTSKGTDDKIGDLKDRLTIIESRTSVSDPTTAITLTRLDEKVARLGRTTDLTTGRSDGMMSLWGLILGAVGLAAGVAAVISIFLKGTGG